MVKQEKTLSFTFVNPNSARSFERELGRILVDKLVAVHKQAMAV